MKLGNTREEMQKNYSETIKKSRKAGKIIAIIATISAALFLLQARGIFIAPTEFERERKLILTAAILMPFAGYIAGHAYYYAFRRMVTWFEAIGDFDSDGSGCLGFFFVFGNIGSIIAYTLCISIFFTLGMIFGTFDWIKIHIDGKKYGLKVKK